MARELEQLAEAQREVVRALGQLTEQLRGGRRGETAARENTPQEREGATSREPAQRGPGLERALEGTSRALEELGATTSTNTRAMSELRRQLESLPGLLGGLAGEGEKKGGGFLKSAFGLGGLVRGIGRLFGGGGEPEDRGTPTAYREPAQLALEVANTENILSGFPRVVRGQAGEARVSEPPRTVVVQPQVTVNVSAMDSRSFLDHSGDITRAVREAMLYMHPVNDLISEL